MKIRSGFVSNSSSSSFAVLLPTNFSFNDYDFTKLENYAHYIKYPPPSKRKEKIDEIKLRTELLAEIAKVIEAEGGVFDEDLVYPFIVGEALCDVGLVLASFETESDCGSMVVVKGEEVEDFLKNGKIKKRDYEKEPLTEAEFDTTVNGYGGISNFVKDAFRNR